MKKLYWALALLFLAFLCRSWIFAMVPFDQHPFSLPGLVAALIGGALAFGCVFGAIVTLEIKSVWQVGGIVILGGMLSSHFGHWLAGIPAIGEFWGGFVNGFIETSILWGALYGAKEVWKGK
jgi:hypothetical protein